MAKKVKRSRAVKSPKVKGSLSAWKVERAVRVVAGEMRFSPASRSASRPRKQAAGRSR